VAVDQLQCVILGCIYVNPQAQVMSVCVLHYSHLCMHTVKYGNADILALRESSYNHLFVTDIMLNGLQVFDTTGWALPCKSLVPAVDAQRLP